MSTSFHVVGFVPPDAKWKKMKEVHDACRKARIDVPKEVCEFFNDEEPDDAGVEIDLMEHECCSDAGEDMVDGYEIDLTKLPKDVTKIRFTISY